MGPSINLPQRAVPGLVLSGRDTPIAARLFGRVKRLI